MNEQCERMLKKSMPIYVFLLSLFCFAYGRISLKWTENLMLLGN